MNIAKKHGVPARVIGAVTDKKGIWLSDGKKETDLTV
jgi:hypothetical protein